MKTRIPAVVLCISLLLSFVTLAGSSAPPSVYRGQLRENTYLLSAPAKDSPRLAHIAAGKYVDILEVEPDWLLVRYRELTGFLRRSCLLDTSVVPLDPSSTPPYATVPCEWLAWVCDEAPVLSAPLEDAEVLISLSDGARLALVDIRDGWGRVIFHRQYGYIDTRHFSEIQPVNRAEAPGNDAPLAAYTSFYKITTDESNLNRIVNLRVACERMASWTLFPGDRLDFNSQVGPYSRRNGYMPANALVKGEVVQSYGGGTCQVSSTLYNIVLQLPGVSVLKRRAHGPEAASYLPHGADAAVGSIAQNFVIQNLSPYPVRFDGTLQDGALTVAAYRAD